MLLVIFSLFAPSVLPLIEDSNIEIALIDFNEEENKKDNKKENKTEMDEKDVFFENIVQFNNRHVGHRLQADSHYLNSSSEFHDKIHLPPPERRS
jgi:hypothetical protein